MMMEVIHARNVHEALPLGIELLLKHGRKQDSRNGPVMVAPGPVITHYAQPKERVIFWAARDANPFFHFYEALWMLAGKNDVESLGKFVKKMYSFSDDEKTLHGAYGYRWLHHFKLDQLTIIIDTLKKDPLSRRCVLQMWDATTDLGRSGKDFPCNTHAYFSLNNMGKLELTVCNRSNDMIWGAYGVNAVHFSMLQEYVAAGIGCEVGCMYQFSNNFHAYLKTFKPIKHLAEVYGTGQYLANPYELSVKPWKLVSTPFEQWKEDLHTWINEGMVMGIRDKFFRGVAQPLMQAHEAYTKLTGMERYNAALYELRGCIATDWQLAAQQWLMRRQHKYMKAQDDGVDYNR